MGELPQQQASSHQGLIKENQLQVKDLNDSPGYFTDGWICHSDIFLHTSSFVNERNLQLDPNKFPKADE